MTILFWNSALSRSLVYLRRGFLAMSSGTVVQGETLFLGISSLGGTDFAVELTPRWNRLLDVDLKISINGNSA